MPNASNPVKVDGLVDALTTVIGAHTAKVSELDIISATYTLALRTAMAVMRLSKEGAIESNRNILLLATAQLESTIRAWPLDIGEQVH